MTHEVCAFSFLQLRPGSLETCVIGVNCSVLQRHHGENICSVEAERCILRGRGDRLTKSPKQLVPSITELMHSMPMRTIRRPHCQYAIEDIAVTYPIPMPI